MEPVNLLQPKRIERFTGDSTNKVFQLTTTNIDADLVTIKSLKADGTFEDLVEGTDFTVDRTLGKFTLNAVKPTPVVGEDNLYVTYAKTVSGYADKVNKCDISILYGINGARNTLFVSGNSEFPHYDWHSKPITLHILAILSIPVVGQDSSKIMGYSIINDKLVTHKDTEESNSTLLRSGKYTDGKVVYSTDGSFQTAGALSKYSFAYFDNEPLYVTYRKQHISSNAK